MTAFLDIYSQKCFMKNLLKCQKISKKCYFNIMFYYILYYRYMMIAERMLYFFIYIYKKINLIWVFF